MLRLLKTTVLAIMAALLIAQAVAAAPSGAVLSSPRRAASGAVAVPEGTPSDPYIVSGPAFRIAVEADGIYRLDYAYLDSAFTNAGLKLSDVDPRTFRLFYMYQEMAIQVLGEEDGRFDPPDPGVPGDPGDAVLFYGRGVDSLFYDGALPTNKYTASTVFWLTYGGAPGLRMAARDGTPSGTPESSFLNSLRWEENLFYEPKLPFEPNADHWYAENPIRTFSFKPTANRDYSFQLNHVATGTADGTLSVSVLGYYAGPHYLRLYVNGEQGARRQPGLDGFQNLHRHGQCASGCPGERPKQGAL